MPPSKSPNTTSSTDSYIFLKIFPSLVRKIFDVLPESELDKIDVVFRKLDPKPKTVAMDVFILYIYETLRKYNSDSLRVLYKFWKTQAHRVVVPYFVYTSPWDYEPILDKSHQVQHLLENALKLDKKNFETDYIFLFELMLDQLPITMSAREFDVFRNILEHNTVKPKRIAEKIGMNPTQASRIFNKLLKKRIIIKKGLLNLDLLGFEIYIAIVYLKDRTSERIFKNPWTYSEIISVYDPTVRFINLVLPNAWLSQFTKPIEKVKELILINDYVKKTDVFKLDKKASHYNFSNYNYRAGKWNEINIDEILSRWSSGSSQVYHAPFMSQAKLSFKLDLLHIKILKTIWDYGPLPTKELRKIIRVNNNVFSSHYSELKKHRLFFEGVFPSLHLTKNEILFITQADEKEWLRIANALMIMPILYYGFYISEDETTYGFYHMRTPDISFSAISGILQKISNPYLLISNEITKEKIWTLPIERWNEDKQIFILHEDDFFSK